MTIGTPGVAGLGQVQFSDPSGMTFGLNGEIYVADGEGRVNARIVKFTRDGKFIKAWGTRGSGRDNLDQPHAIAVDSTGRVFVADRRNNRVVILDADLQYIAEWRQFGRPSGLAIDKNDILYVTDSQTTEGRPGFRNGIYIGSAKDGKVTAFIPAGLSGTPEGIAGLSVDAWGHNLGLRRADGFQVRAQVTTQVYSLPFPLLTGRFLVKRWFFGLMLVLSAVFAIIPMPSVGQTPKRRRMRHPGLAKGSRTCRASGRRCQHGVVGPRGLISATHRGAGWPQRRRRGRDPVSAVGPGEEEGKLRQLSDPRHRGEMLSAWRAAHHLHALPVSDSSAAGHRHGPVRIRPCSTSRHIYT